MSKLHMFCKDKRKKEKERKRKEKKRKGKETKGKGKEILLTQKQKNVYLDPMN